MGDGRLRHEERRRDVRLPLQLEALERRVGERPRVEDAGAVNDAVDVAERRDRLGDHSLGRCHIRQLGV